jgi:hypothetical protein
MVTPARRSWSLTVVEETPCSSPIWRRVQPWAYKSAARSMSTSATVTSLDLQETNKGGMRI